MPTDEQYTPGQLYMINLNDLLPDSDQPRKYLEPEALKLMGAVLAVAAKECQIVIFTCVPERYAFIGEAAVVPL